MAEKTVKAKIQLSVTGASAAAKELGGVNAQVEKTRQEIERFKKQGGLNAISAGADRINVAQAQLARLALQLNDVEAEAKAVRKALSETSDAVKLDQLNRKFLELQESAAGLRLEIAKIPRDLRESVTETAGFLGDIDTGLSTLAGSAASIGGRVTGVLGAAGVQLQSGPLSGVAGGLQLGAEAFAAAEAVPRLTNALGTMRERLGQISLNSITANKDLIGMGAAIGIVGIAAAGITLAAQESKKGLLEYIEAQKKAEQSTAALRAQLEQLSSAADISRLEASNEARRRAIQQEIADLETKRAETESSAIFRIQDVAESSLFGMVDPLGSVAKGMDQLGVNTDEADARIKELNDELKALDESSAQLNSALAQVSIQARQAANELDNQLARYLTMIRLQADGTSEELDRLLEETRQNILANQFLQVDATGALYTALLAQAATILSPEAIAAAISAGPEAAIGMLTEGITSAGQELTPGVVDLQNKFDEIGNNIGTLSQDLENLNNPALRESITLREQEAAALERAQAAFEDFNRVTEQIQDIEAEIAKQREDEARQAQRDGQVAALENQIRLAEAKEAAAKQTSEINQIRAEGAKQEKAIVDKTVKADRDARAKLLNGISKINADFMAAELKAWEAYRVSEQRITEDTQRERLRLLEDTEKELRNAARRNDISAFLRAQEAGTTGLRRLDEDASVEARRRSQDFQLERAQAAKERDQRLADLKAQYNAEKQQRDAAAKEELAQVQTTTQAKLDQQKAAGQQEISESQRLRNELAVLRERWAEQDKQRERNQRLQGQQQELNDLRRHQTTLLNTIRQAQQQQINTVSAAGRTINNLLSQALNSINRGGTTSTTSTSTGTNQRTSVNVPLLGNVNIGTPNTQSARGGSSGGGSGTTNTIYVNAQVGELVTPSEVNLVVDNLKKAIIDGLNG